MTPVKFISPIGEVDVIETPPLTGLLCNSRAISASGSPLDPYINQRDVLITSHSSRQTIQRTGTLTSVTFSGFVYGQRPLVEVRYNNGSWTLANSNKSTGTWSCTMSLPSGQGNLDVRVLNEPDTTTTLVKVGVGDVICIGGQSNGAGRGFNNQSYSHASLFASSFNKAYEWVDLTDPTSDSTGLLDPVLYDYDAGGMGSVWPLVATAYMAARGRPLSIVPCCRGGTGIGAWRPPATQFNRSTLAGAMMYRASITGAKLICWWQGEGGIDDVTGSSYYNQYMQLSAAVAAAVPGCKMMPAMLQHCTDGSLTDVQQNNHRTAISYIWANDPNSVQGPTMAATSPAGVDDLTTDDGFHLQTDINLQAAATRWLNAIIAAIPE